MTEVTEGQTFDVVLKFTGSIENSELLITDLVKAVLEDYIKQHGTVVLKINWWSPDLHVFQNTSVEPQEAARGTIDSNPSPNTKDD